MKRFVALLSNSDQYWDMEKERETWKNHRLQFDRRVRLANLKLLDQFVIGNDIYLLIVRTRGEPKHLEQWFVSNGCYMFGFHANNDDIFKATVKITRSVQFATANSCVVVGMSAMSEIICCRMQQLIGMNNISHCLRNSEHVANYVFCGKWFSQRTLDRKSLLYNYFGNDFERTRYVNHFPSCVFPTLSAESSEKVYTFVDSSWTALSVEYCLNDNSGYNILFIGPCGGGKSHLINVLFNRHVCSSEAGHEPVTDELYFVRGQRNKGENDVEELVIADTMGLCGKQWFSQDNKIAMKTRIDGSLHIDAVCVVFRAGRLEPDQVSDIKQALDLLGYRNERNSERFVFVGTHAEHVSLQDRERLSREATRMLGIAPSSSIVYTGFALEDNLNDKNRSICMSDYRVLKESFPVRSGDPIAVPKCSVM